MIKHFKQFKRYFGFGLAVLACTWSIGVTVHLTHPVDLGAYMWGALVMLFFCSIMFASEIAYRRVNKNQER